MRTFTILALSAFAGLVSAHGLVTNVQGANGNTGQAFAMDPNTPRSGTGRNPFQQDTSIIRDREIASGKSSACGRTLQAGSVNIESSLAAASAAGLPSADAQGNVRFTIHQINGDGGGPYEAAVDTTATGNNWQPATFVTNVAGRRGNNRATQLTDHSVVVQVPAGTQCTGGPNGDACIMRVRNGAAAGPFGGCFAFTMDNQGAQRPAPAAGQPAAGAPAAGEPAPAAGEPAPAAAVVERREVDGDDASAAADAEDTEEDPNDF